MTDVWIRTEPALDGSGYMVTLSVGEDSIVHLTPERAFTYARTVMAYVFRADLCRDRNGSEPACRIAERQQCRKHREDFLPS